MLSILQARFEANKHRHPDILWDSVVEKINSYPEKLISLEQMESTGGEPDVIGFEDGCYIFCDCSPQTPAGRRGICYDQAGEDERTKKGVFPSGNAVGLAAKMGIELLDEAQYRYLQSLESFDTRSSSWILTPPEIRNLGGALFADCHYGRTFVYHNSAPSFYSGRAFRGLLRI